MTLLEALIAALERAPTINVRQLSVLALAVEEPGLSLTHHAKRLKAKKLNVLRSLDTLEEMGLISREQADNKRFIRILPTPLGVAFIDAVEGRESTVVMQPVVVSAAGVEASAAL